ncbi:hypothetical protein GRI89_01620 [Altererythrobacter salegens]|uniref:Uncharacterized protein n=1 Tax=Croceibacterium salegens TaxID=1737568 RepID=A0A6I4SQX0_9SPHN|nr:hypothetical protein [Croceibacterium salegens]MXO58243.1 hypothetical protein [Croceibacterium salegens]
MKPPTILGIAAVGALVGALAMYMAMPPATPHPGAEEEAAAAEKAPAAGSALGTLQLDANTMQEAGIELAALAPATRAEEKSGFARALDLSPLAAIASDLATARAALAASQSEAQRLTALAAEDQSASLRDVEAARAQAVADRARVNLACDRVALEFGAGLRRIGCDAIPGLVNRVAAGNAVLLRIDIPDASLPAGAAVVVGEEPRSVLVRVLGPAAMSEAQLQTAGALALAGGRTAAEAQVGRVLPAYVATGLARAGVIVPREALVRVDGGAFVYRSARHGGFARAPVDTGNPVAEGYFVPEGTLHPGERIVVAGAGTLLGLERGAPAEEE